MFGIGFTELLIISIIAILFLGPDKLPQALVEMAKFIKSVKKTIGEAKSSLEEEMNIADLKEEALNYKKKLDSATDELKSFKNIDFDDFDDMSYDDEVSTETSKKATKKSKDTYTQAPTTLQEDVLNDSTTQVEPKNKTVTLSKKSKKMNSENNDKISKGDV